MKNLIFALVSLFAFSVTNIDAQSIQRQVNNTMTEDNGEFEILKEYKATKQEKKVIAKIQKYVTPRIFAGVKHTAAFEGKSVKVQVNFDDKGAISNIAMVNGEMPDLDEKVISLIREYDQKNPIAATNIDKPSAIQLNIALVGKRYFIN